MWDTQLFIYTKKTAILLQRDETRRVCSSNTRATVLDWFVGDGELSQVVTTHLGLQRGGETDRFTLVTRHIHKATSNTAVSEVYRAENSVQTLQGRLLTSGQETTAISI